MREFHPIDIKDLDLNAWKTIGEDWLLVTAGGKKHHNTMTISWGAFGEHWNRPTVTVMLRPQRYTRGFVEKREKFSISILSQTDDTKKKLAYLGRVSGRDENKLEKVDLHYNRMDKVPSIQEAEYVINCKVIYRDQINKDNFILPDLAKEHYPEKAYHYIYIGEIVSVYKAVEVEE